MLQVQGHEQQHDGQHEPTSSFGTHLLIYCLILVIILIVSPAVHIWALFLLFPSRKPISEKKLLQNILNNNTGLSTKVIKLW